MGRRSSMSSRYSAETSASAERLRPFALTAVFTFVNTTSFKPLPVSHAIGSQSCVPIRAHAATVMESLRLAPHQVAQRIKEAFRTKRCVSPCR